MDAAFWELTVLGFIGVVLFLVQSLDVMPKLSVALFDEEDEMNEIFEIVHMALFGVMFLFLTSAFLNLYSSYGIGKKWQKWEGIFLC